MRHLQGTKDLMLTYQRTSDSDFAVYVDNNCYIFMMAEVRGKVSSKHLQLLQLWKQSMWCVMRLLVMHYGVKLHFNFGGCSLHLH